MERLLQWSLAHSGGNNPPEDGSGDDRRTPRLDPEVLAHLLGGKDDAQLMVEAMQAITDNTLTLENRSIAWDNLEQLVESLDNANNIQNLGLWPSLVQQLEAPEKEMRFMAAWVCGTAVQNNVKTQEHFHATDGISKLVNLALTDKDLDVRSKSCYAISSYTRNFQRGLDQCLEHLPDDMKQEFQDKINAEDMEAIDAFRDRLKLEGTKRTAVAAAAASNGNV